MTDKQAPESRGTEGMDIELDSLMPQIRSLVIAYACASMDWDWANDEAEAQKHLDRKHSILLDIERRLALLATQRSTEPAVRGDAGDEP